jgi:hypothetical protein
MLHHSTDAKQWLRKAAIMLSLDDQISRTIPATQRRFFDPPDLSRSLLAAREPGTHVKSGCRETVEGEAGMSNHCV